MFEVTCETSRSDGTASCLSLSNTSETLPISTTKNITCVGLSPDGNLAVVVDEGKTLR